MMSAALPAADPSPDIPVSSSLTSAVLFGAALTATPTLPARTQSRPPENWPAIKSERDTKAYVEALSELGRKSTYCLMSG
ncbi:hypothetical protein [Bosea sp. (in: a-proteobacteria)]|uniref:hypothetical protein n=1 Tax=Bosea sp. (in: a-proteobacteria) TaxID=1871050 RepID=UPI002B46ED9B|nr:hypothetical protein [Bosea sp. (in: a-proteobacteria)]WRH56320.1 MAG: hypothetical protein RSE11_14830 [Bosea sp. (in: a-proteobacteria)]